MGATWYLVPSSPLIGHYEYVYEYRYRYLFSKAWYYIITILVPTGTR